MADVRLRATLRDHYRKHRRYSTGAHIALVQDLFKALFAYNPQYLPLFFPNGSPPFDKQKAWSLSEAQGAISGAEYTEAARGKRCGHIFKSGEVTYSCRTCAVDDTCVLCARCFEASDHDGHQVNIHVSPGATGCCDCGDEEAWAKPVNCSIHTAHAAGKPDSQLHDKQTSEPGTLPKDLVEAMKATLSCCFDFICDVFSCASETMRLLKDEDSIRQNELRSRLSALKYDTKDNDEADETYALVLWNDEKHTLDEVTEQVARACRKPKSFGTEKAKEVDKIGRSTIMFSRNIQELLRACTILEQIKVTITIRAARDVFREEMCATIVDWIADIAGCSVGTDHHILMDTICEEMLMPWQMGSSAINLQVGRQGIRDEQKTDRRLEVQHARNFRRQMQEVFRMQQAARRRARLENGETGPLTANADPAQLQPIEAMGGQFVTLTNATERDLDQDGDADAMDLDEVEDDGEADIAMFEITDDGRGAALVEDLVDVIDLSTMGMNMQAEDEQEMETALSDDGNFPETFPGHERQQLLSTIPKTPNVDRPLHSGPPIYWFDAGKPKIQLTAETSLPIYEDLSQRVRIDFLIMYDMRMWKVLRNNLRHLYIGTVVTIPYFKRVLGLRFAAIYTWLAQLFLIADREPEHSIINLSLQMLTTASIAKEVVDRENFLTKLLAILYTFLTKRQVGHPSDVDTGAMISFENGVLTNRRVNHFFLDMKYLLESPYVQERIREDDEYLLQFLDFVKLYQGICYNVRATGEHVEYESDTWIAASLIGSKVNMITRHFCEAFQWNRMQDAASICRAIRQTAKAAIVNSMGVEHDRFTQSELQHITKFKTIEPFPFEKQVGVLSNGGHIVVDVVIEQQPMSFHHQLHNMLSWLIDSGKSMSRQQLQGLLDFSQYQLQVSDPRSKRTPPVPHRSSAEYLLALYDIPLRLCAWMAQVKAGMWVRNGMALRGQMQSYRSIGHREYAHQRDIFLLQTAFITVDSATMLASMIERFGLTSWMSGNLSINPGWEDHQMMDMTDDFLHLVVNLLSERLTLVPRAEEPRIAQLMARREIAHALLFKPLSHSDLIGRLSESALDLPDFSEILRDCTRFKAPEGLQDSGTFEMKSELYAEIDPYNPYFNKNQRDEAETIWRKHVSKSTGEDLRNVVYEPRLREIRTGVFANLGAVVHTPIFAQVIFSSLLLTLSFGKIGKLPDSRLESLLPLVLHLTLMGLLENDSDLQPNGSFVDHVLSVAMPGEDSNSSTIFALLCRLRTSEGHRASRSKISLVLRRISEKRSVAFKGAIQQLGYNADTDADSLTSDATAEILAEKKRQAKLRQEKVMAAFKKQQNEFIEKQPKIDWGLDDDDALYADDMLSATQEKRSWVYPSGTCIFCQEDTNDQKLYGTLAHINESRILRQTPLDDLDYVAEACVVPSSLDRESPPVRPFGVANKNTQQVFKASADGDFISIERRGLGKGFPLGHSRPGPVATSCGHIMHFSCLETYNQATQRRQSFQVARHHPENIKRKEFVCPLCKALGNAFMPVLWKPKECLDPGSASGGSFEQWLTVQVPFLISNGADLPQYQRIFQNYGAETLNPHLAARLPEPSKESPPASRFALPSFLSFGDSRESARTGSRDSRAAASNSTVIPELLKAYHRLQETLYENNIWSHHPYGRFAAPDGELTNTDSLARCIGYSISAVEIAHRGCAAPGLTLLSGIPEQTLTHLRILSETTSSYVAIGGLHNIANASIHKPAPEVPECSKQQIRQLFGIGSTFEEHNGPLDLANLVPLLSQDIFVFLTECSVYMVPHLRIDMHNVMQLCYLAETVKVVLAFLETPDSLWQVAQDEQPTKKEQKLPESADLEPFSAFVQHIIQERGTSGLVEQGERSLTVPELENPNARYTFDKKLLKIVQAQVLVFLRKCTILLHARFGVDFERSEVFGDTDFGEAIERQRLSLFLGLPSMQEMFAMVNSNSSAGRTLLRMTGHWIKHWTLAQEARPRAAAHKLQISHAGIFELVALPTAFDVFNTEVLSRRCPTTGNELNDPCVCLFCGAIFCGQAQCCMQRVSNGGRGNGEGGCYQHQEKCGGTIGMYLNIRKCAGLFLNGRNGTWMPAPYLDQYGEVDYGMRRREQLWLNSRRWDKLFREVWLQHGVPSAVARKLEGDVNTGGWETM